MPAKSWKLYTNTDRQALLNDSFFRTALYLASPGLFERLNLADFKYERMSEREQLTIQRYFNRISFRPTPFGLFSSVSLVSWGSKTDVEILEHDLKITVQPDQTYVMTMGRELLLNELAPISSFIPNPSLYRTANEYRFIRTSIDNSNNKRDYLLQSTAFSKSLKDLIVYCLAGKNKNDVIKFIENEWGCSAQDGEDYFEFLTDAQLLINSLNANITGQDYLSRLDQHLSNAGITSIRTLKLKNLLKSLDDPAITPAFFKDISNSLLSLLPGQNENINFRDEQLNVILGRELAGSVDKKYQGQIADALFALDKLAAKDAVPNMEKFARTFQLHFEGQSLPLLAALDPETGIGYQDYAPESNNRLLETVNIQPNYSLKKALDWTAAHSYLLDCWQKIRDGAPPVIRLGHDELVNLKAGDESPPIQGLSILFRIVKDKIYLESAGGVNAPALMGRFTVTGTDIHEAACSIARAQEAVNPEIIFAELLHLADPHVDNVNRREKIWSWEIPVTATSLNEPAYQLELSDLHVSIENDKVVLRSLKHNKVVIPRLTSAYNHSNNRLPLFRFLADISYQFGRSNLLLDLRQFFPGISFYPSVEYKGTILHLATWIISEKEIASLQMAKHQDVIAAFEQISKARQLPDMFSLTEGDQQLTFNRDSAEDRLFFAACIKQKKEAVIKEYHRDELENGFVNQFNAFIYSGEPISIPSMPRQALLAGKQQRKFIPGSEWLYLKIYSSRIGASRLLFRIIPLLRRTYKHGKIGRWFFIRYEDHAPHIRLRMRISPDDISEVLIAFKEKLEDRIKHHVIREYQIDTYSRELERYQTNGFEVTEQFFCASSEFVVSYLKRSQNDSNLPPYLFALLTMKEMLNLFLANNDSELAFVYKVYLKFTSEYNAPKLHVELDKKYRQLSAPIQAAFQDSAVYKKYGIGMVARRFNSAVSLMAQSNRATDKDELLVSMIHMHLNRIFIDDSRKQEMMAYYLLYKFLLSEKGRLKKGTL
jgi:lantibiotic biosynthesis protein